MLQVHMVSLLSVWAMETNMKCQNKFFSCRKLMLLLTTRSIVTRGFESLGTSKLYDILNSIKPAQQKAVTGLDEFVVKGVEVWRGLSDM